MTFHLHIKGRVHGVGFRPHIYKIALQRNMVGYVSNEADGVHVFFNSSSFSEADSFSHEVIGNAPSHSIIQSWDLAESLPTSFKDFKIRVEDNNGSPDLLISPDFALCAECRKEFHDPENRRYQYPFITCTLCGPRYSIMDRLPYERHLTTMRHFTQCPECRKEYDDVNDRRYFSQTNSCPTCGIRLSWHSKKNGPTISEANEIRKELLAVLTEGKIIAVKGIGGYLLMCDAANVEAIANLRIRKNRPAKPLAVLFPNIEMVKEFTIAGPSAIQQLSGEVSPVVVLSAGPKSFEHLDMYGIAPSLTSIGVMIPYAPLLEWIISAWKKPLIATSGNLSGSSIIFHSEQKEELFAYADYILDHNRDIVIPQDDSVVRLSEESQQSIIIRRSRGLAPSIIVETEKTETVFAAGAMLKSAFAFQHNQQIYLSQFLGNLESFDGQENYSDTYRHFTALLKTTSKIILCDPHPDYPSTQMATMLSEELNVPLKKIQHHEAHFAAILGEHHLFSSDEKILGVVWDGTGLGEDGNIWGGEFFIYEKGKIERVHFLEPFPNIAGDRMANEPRLAALSIANNSDSGTSHLLSKFEEKEWQFYQKLLQHPSLTNTSAGRYFDGVSSLLNLINVNSYEGEAALMLEDRAAHFLRNNNAQLGRTYFGEVIDRPAIPMRNLISRICDDLNAGVDRAEIAAIFHNSLVNIILKVARKTGARKITFSGGVFQNAVLVDLLIMQRGPIHMLYHQQMPPNDECIAFGQLMHHRFLKT